MIKLIKFNFSEAPYYFPMDEIVGDTLIGDINATLHNGPTLVDGIKDKAISFNGVDQYADYGNVA